MYLNGAGVVNGKTIHEDVYNQTNQIQKIKTVSGTNQSQQNGQTGAWGVFSNPTEQFGEKSMFNKEKYLPLARDIPVAISHLCCSKMKKSPIKAYQRKNGFVPFLGTLAEESRIRKQAWIRHGCNAFDSKSPTSQPLSFWTEQDILKYIIQNSLEIASVYGDIVAVDSYGNEYPAESTLIDGCKLKCSGCDRTGQINAAR